MRILSLIVIMLVCCIFGLSYINKKLVSLETQNITPTLNDDGTVDYTLVANRIFFGKPENHFEHWVLRFPEEVYVHLPESLNDDILGELKVNGVSLNTISKPNQKIILFANISEFRFLKKTEIKDKESSKVSLTILSDKEIYKKQKNTPSGVINEVGAFFSSNWTHTVLCRKNRQVSPGIYLVRNETNDEWVERNGERKRILFCYSNKTDKPITTERYTIYNSLDNFIGHGRCINLLRKVGKSCTFIMWLPQNRIIHIKIDKAYIGKLMPFYEWLISKLEDATVMKKSLNFNIGKSYD